MGKAITTLIFVDLNVIGGFKLFVYLSFYLFLDQMILCIIRPLLLSRCNFV